jgi:hypothetical protein
MASSEPGFGDRFTLTRVTDDPDQAAAADAAGVDRIGIDIERLGKAGRQAAQKKARISTHRLEDLERLAPRLRQARLFCRIDPPHPGSAEQIERALEFGAVILMLPYFTETAEAARFVDQVAGRAHTVALAETAAAAWRIEHLAEIDGLDEIMVGLNDLSWEMGVSDRFTLLASPLMQALAATVRGAGKQLSMGGLGRWDDPGLPTSPDVIYAQYPRLDAGGAWLARSFYATEDAFDWPAAVQTLRRRLDHWASQDPDVLETARRALART